MTEITETETGAVPLELLRQGIPVQAVITGELTSDMKYVVTDLILGTMIAMTVILLMEMDVMTLELLNWDILVQEEQQQLLMVAKKYVGMD
jgi:hypothetical protein